MAKANTSAPGGFPEFTPAQQRVVQHWKKTIGEVFEKHGFPLLETPLVERAENFVAKGGNPKEIYVLDRLLREEAVDQDKDQRAIRFDHTVPLALFVARHFNELSFPFRRSVIGPVMRGERQQKGRFRQFDQCDIDVIGSENLSLANDAQMVAIIVEIFEKLMPEQKFIVRINNRKIISGQAKAGGATPKEIWEITDNREKTGQKKYEQEIAKAIKNKEVFSIFSDKVISEIDKARKKRDWEKYLELLENSLGKLHEECKAGLGELRKVIAYLDSMKIDREKYDLDPFVARGLDYYTGTVFETHLVGSEDLGSICSGGRYDDLAQIFTGKQLPGVGISIGLTRLLWQLFDAKILTPEQATSSEVIVLSRSPEVLPRSLEIAQKLRSKNIPTEVYLEPKKIQKQFAYAQKMGIPARVIVGDDVVVETEDPGLEKKINSLL